MIKILRNIAAIGQFQPCKMVNGKRVPEGDVLNGYFERVIEDGLFYRVQDMRAAKRVPSGPKGASRNLFTGIAKCARCNSPMHRIDKGPRWQYLICSNALRGNGCNYETWKLDDFENVVLTSLLKDMDWAGLSPRVRETAASAIEQLEERLAELRSRRDQNEKRIENIIDELEIDGASAPLRKRRQTLEAALADLAVQEKQVEGQLIVERQRLATAKSTSKEILKAFAEWMSDHAQNGLSGDPEATSKARQRLAGVLRENLQEILLGTKGNDRIVEVVFKQESGIHSKPRLVLPFDVLVSLGAAIPKTNLPLLPVPSKQKQKRKTAH